MPDYVIITDSTGDLTAPLVKEADVEVIPMQFTSGEKTYLNYPDERELPIKKFYDMMREGAVFTTAQVTFQTYMDTAAPFLEAGRDVLMLIFSSGLSGSFNSSRLAVENLREKYPQRKIRTVDTLSAALGEGLLVFRAAKLRQAGKSLDEVAEWVVQNRDHLCHWFTVDDLRYLRRGGRISSTAALVGGMLNIKPVMHVDLQGHLTVTEKVRGRRQSLDALVRHLEDTIIDGENDTIFIGHADALEDARYMADRVRGRHGIRRIEFGYVGPVIGSHTGPGQVEIFFSGTVK